MSHALAPLTLDAFLEWERSQELRHEFDGVQPIAMTGGSVEHGQIGTNIVLELGGRLRGSPCRIFSNDMKILVKGRIRYPDVVVTCTATPRGGDVLVAPVVVFEILSKSTASVDRIVKNDEYRATPSIQHYVMLEQTRIGATMFSRDPEGWTGRVLTADATLDLPAIGVSVKLAALYGGIIFDQDGDGQ